jgi:hypothetical protein
VAAHRLAQPRLAREGNEAVVNKSHVVAGAAGIGNDRHVAAAYDLRVVTASDRRHCWPGFHGMYGMGCEVRGVDHASQRAHGQELTAESGHGQTLMQARQIAAHQRLKRCVDAGGGGATVFPDGGIDAMRKRVRDAWEVLLEELTHALLVRRRQHRPEQTDADGLDFSLAQARDDLPYGAFIERHYNLSRRIHALRHFEGKATRNIGRGKRHFVVKRFAASSFAKQQDIGMAGGGEEGCASSAVGENCVRCQRRGVDEHIDTGEELLKRATVARRRERERVEHADRRILRRCRGFEQPKLSRCRLRNQVREGAAHIR